MPSLALLQYTFSTNFFSLSEAINRIFKKDEAKVAFKADLESSSFFAVDLFDNLVELAFRIVKDSVQLFKFFALIISDDVVCIDRIDLFQGVHKSFRLDFKLDQLFQARCQLLHVTHQRSFGLSLSYFPLKSNR